ncbi:hypothetical protein [Sphingobacterium rhinopitheci]|uniref:hypothetical protein n=1 Tax=Sphingobacterium rhinopitheci TaxID=2781960 RepID=UPI001F5263AA|nr:hypothetical protein [Sphingobacterium rhinopitheci]MCI0921554.1 hypothetical protein [Sphingobacterium rhinopitheci]
MENQLKETESLNVKGIILLVAAVFSALIASVACGTFLSIIGGAVVGLVFAVFFNSVLLPQRESDR